MSKALVIKSANFGTNKVTAVSFGGSVPCTGIDIEESSITISDGEAVALEYSVTPANTTDAISWTSSNNSVATVSNGVVTPVGAGTATITATCGNFSDTASVTVEVAGSIVYQGGARTTKTTNSGVDIPSSSAYSKRATACGSEGLATTYTSGGTGGVPDLHAIKLPAGATGVKVSRNADKASIFANDTHLEICWTKDEYCGIQALPTVMKLVGYETGNLYSTQTYTFTKPSDADSFFVSVGLASAPADFDDTLESAGFTIEILTE